ncbi:hypothetical protein GCM10027400_01830 [Pseudoxanthomonas daejeonensis]
MHEPDGLRRLLPRYEANPKHGPLPYWAGGGLVAPMTVGDDDAQAALYAAVSDGAGHFFGVHDAKFLKFVLTGYLGGPVYHAYEVIESEVPPDILLHVRSR